MVDSDADQPGWLVPEWPASRHGSSHSLFLFQTAPHMLRAAHHAWCAARMGPGWCRHAGPCAALWAALITPF